MKNLYRRYRPLKLSEVVGQEQVTEALKKSLEAGKVGHAYLFVGPRGCGKTSVARILAHEINGFKYELEDDYVDIIEIDGASNRGIDNIRELREKAAIAPTAGKYKVYIIDEVHMLTKEAFNALLKTLEEPPAHVVFIMATTDAYKVPVTITSRAQVYTFKLVGTNVMVPHLKLICEKEGIKISDEALEVIAKRGGGSFRDSLSLLDQISTLSESEITKELVVLAMGLPEDEEIAELLEDYIAGDIKKIANDLKDLLSSGVKAETITEELISAIVAEPKPELLPLLAKLPEVKAPYAEARLLVALVEGQSGTYFLEASRGHDRSMKGPSPVTTAPWDVDDLRSTGVRNPVPQKVMSEVSVEDNKKSEQNIPQVDSSRGVFDWAQFLETVHGMNDAIYLQLKSVEHGVNGNTLDIYPTKRISKTILARDNNRRILIEAAGGMKVVVHEVGENPNMEKDELISKISGIMGGEVQNDGGGTK